MDDGIDTCVGLPDPKVSKAIKTEHKAASGIEVMRSDGPRYAFAHTRY